MNKNFTKSLLGVATALALTSGAATAAEEWKGWNIHTEGYPNTVAMDKFSELVAEKNQR